MLLKDYYKIQDGKLHLIIQVDATKIIPFIDL